MKVKSIVFIIIIALILLIGSTMVNAAGATITASSNNVEEGENVTINVSFTAAAWNLTVSGDKITGESYASQTSDLSETTIKKNFPMDTSKEGTYVVKITGDITDESGKTIPVNESTSVKVTKKVVDTQPDPTPDPEPTPDPQPDPEPTPDPQPETTPEPKFTSTNQIVYATDTINLRESWSTSSAAIQVKKGTEMTLTGTSTETINRYVWYRVNYNGQTRYVAKYLVTTTKPEEEEEKSNNANLKSLKTNPEGIKQEFKANVLEYSIDVNSELNEIEVTAVAEDEKAIVKVEGNKNLQIGENIVKIIVTAEDGKTKKEYKLKVNKADNVDNEQTETFGLYSLIIKDTDIENKFNTNVYEYNVYIKDVESLDIDAVATEEDAIIEILGNENLSEENTITIIVKSSDETKTSTYQIKAIKLNVIGETKQQSTIDMKIIIFAAIAIVAFIALIIVIVYVIKNRKINEEEDFYDEEQEYSNDEDETDYEEVPELPERKFEDEDGFDSNERRGKHF